MKLGVSKKLNIVSKTDLSLILVETIPLVETATNGFENGQKSKEEIHQQSRKEIPQAFPMRFSRIIIRNMCHEYMKKRPALYAPVFGSDNYFDLDCR